MATHNEVGNLGEQLAVQYLKEHQYKISQTNWHYLKAEIDIIAFKKNTLVIVEVKTRQFNSVEAPEVAVNNNKKRLLVKAANAYIEKYNVDLEVRFDIVTVILNNSKPTIHHIKNAFTALELL